MTNNYCEEVFGGGSDEEMLLISLPLTKRQMTWATMLCEQGDEKEFIQIYQKSASSELAIMRYRRCLHDRCEVVVKEIDLHVAFNTEDHIALHSLLQDLFLEVIDSSQYDHTIKCIDGKCKNLQSIYDIHDENKGLKLQKVLLKLLYQQ